ncbi:aspartyl/asparaginyl beta-hydroxylase isoform X2 [Battus philenor]|uniref:aspartyl/asparaginyl beta-hydroxylase isoform X2 n=1 Tax=Battus philenor TaxID=42288 RepID=UPI0035CED73F
MSGDVQPRKRKEKRRKKDELGVEELRGTAAVFGEGDVLMHSQHEHGTGGHWCAKIIFFSLLAVLITLIGLIILENRGLSELEANAVESRYSGVLEGWIEDAPDDDHHDEHTLELRDHSYEDIPDHGDDEESIALEDNDTDDDHNEDFHDNEDIHDDEDNDEEDNHSEEDNNNEDEDNESDEEENYGSEENILEDDEDVSAEQNVEEDNEDDEKLEYNKYYKYDDQSEDDPDGDDNNNSQEEQDNDNSEEYVNNEEVNDDESNEYNDDNENNNDEQDSKENYDTGSKDDNNEYSQENEEEDLSDEEIERIEREFEDEEVIAAQVSNLEDDLINDKQDHDEIKDEDDDDDEEEDPDAIEPPIVEQIPVLSGKPFVEFEDETSSEKPTDTLAEEEEYEKRQEQIRHEKEEASSQNIPQNEDVSREESPSLVDRRMTLIPERSEPPSPEEVYKPTYIEPVETPVSYPTVSRSVAIQEKKVDEEVEINANTEDTSIRKEVDKELYSDDDDEEVEDEEEIEERNENPAEDKPAIENEAESETEEIPDDVEIIDDDQIEEEIEEEDEDEEEISDVDDAELLSRLEAKYGRLPEPHRPGQKHNDGGNNVEDEWPGEPSDPYWRQQLDDAEQEIRQGTWAAVNERLSVAALAGSARALWLSARSLDLAAEQRRDNKLLSRAIVAYLQLLKMSDRLSDTKLLEVTTRTLDRIQFRGNYLSAEPVYRVLIRRFPNEVSYRNNLTVSFLMANRADLAHDVLKETLKLWPNDRTALAHHGFVLKTHFNKLEESVGLFYKALENDIGPACEPRFYYHLGDALLLLGRFKEAHEVHKRGAKHGHFLSPAQRSLYNVKRLKSRPWWQIEQTPYIKLAQALENSWRDILKEGEAARALYEKEKEGLKEKGEWTQLDIFVRGQEIPGRCKRAPVTCSIVKAEVAAARCRRGQIKFSSMEPGTHVRPHVGPTNCRLRMHLGLSNTKDTYIRVDQETRQWQLGKVLLFDDSFEHEVWHNGTGTRLVLIVDVWHPDLTPNERRQLPAI